MSPQVLCYGLLFLFSGVFAQTPFMHLSPGYRVSWKIQPDQQTIRFTLALDARAWLGIGWHCIDQSCQADGPGMTHADFAIALFNDTTGELIEVFDGVASPAHSGFTKPLHDIQINGTNDIHVISAYQTRNPDFTVVTFERRLVTNDTIADHPLVNATMNFIWAHGDLTKNSSNEFHFHGSFAGTAHINPFSVPGPDEEVNYLIDLRKWHGTLMAVAFGVIMSWAIFVARYLKGYHWWFSLHIIMQVVAFGLVGVAFFLIILMKITGGYEHFVTLHAKLGLGVIIVFTVNIMMGVVSHLLYNPKRLGPPCWPDKFHWWIGRLVLLSGYTNVILGFLNPYNGFEVFVSVLTAFCFLVGLYLLLFVYLELYRCFVGDKVVTENYDSRAEKKPLLKNTEIERGHTINLT